MHLDLNNMPPSCGWYERMLTDISKDLATNPENNPLAVKKALEAIVKGEQVSSKGLSEHSYAKMKDFANKMQSLKPAANQALKKDLQERVDRSFAQTHFSTLSSTLSHDILSDNLLPYLEVKDLKAISKLSKAWNQAINKQADIKILNYSIHVQSYRQGKGPLPTLDIEKEYFNYRNFEDLHKALAKEEYYKTFEESKRAVKKVDFQKVLSRLLHDPALRPPDSAAECLTFYLMQNLGWDVEDPAFEPLPNSETEVAKLSKSLSNLIRCRPNEKPSWDVISKYPKAFVIFAKGFDSKCSLADWAYQKLYLDEFRDVKQAVILAMQAKLTEAYKRASPELQKDKEVLLFAILHKPLEMSFVLYVFEVINKSESLKTDPDLQNALDQSLLKEIKNMKAAVGLSDYSKAVEGMMSQDIMNKAFRLPITSKERALNFIKQEEWAFLLVDKTLREDPQFLHEAIKKNKKVEEVIKFLYPAFTIHGLSV